MSLNECGGCSGLGAHRRWCPEVVGSKAAKIGEAAAKVDALGDSLSGVSPWSANACWGLAHRLEKDADYLAQAFQLEKKAGDTAQATLLIDANDAELTDEHVLEHSGERLRYVHRPSVCEGRRCPIHRMTNHSMRSFPQHWRGDRGIIERICPHGIGHPDPDSPPWTDWTHGCDGCCGGAYEKEEA